MQTIYKPKGKAREYAELALNLFRGCPHGCTYCYAPAMLHMSREDFHRKAEPRIDILTTLEKDAKKFQGKSIFLCFSCDPYPPDDNQEMARQAIKILHAQGCTVTILTKSGLRASRDFDILCHRDRFGVTLTDIGDDVSEYEPFAAPAWERISTLVKAHEMGIYTWVSLEPVIDHEETLKIIILTKAFVDEYKMGLWNYDARAKNINWKQFLLRATRMLEYLGKTYYIKEDLRKAAEEC